MTIIRKLGLPALTAMVALGLLLSLWAVNSGGNAGGESGGLQKAAEERRDTVGAIYRCMADRGISVEATKEGGYVASSNIGDGRDTERLEQAHEACEEQNSSKRGITPEQWAQMQGSYK